MFVKMGRVGRIICNYYYYHKINFFIKKKFIFYSALPAPVILAVNFETKHCDMLLILHSMLLDFKTFVFQTSIKFFLTARSFIHLQAILAIFLVQLRG